MRSALIFAGFVIAAATVLFLNIPSEPASPKKAESPQRNEPHVINLRLGHSMPENSTLQRAVTRYAQQVNERSQGMITVELSPNQQLGNDHQMVEMARKGELDLLLTPTAKMSVPVPSMQYADLPFYFPSRQDLYELLDGEPGQMLLRELRSIGLIGMTFWDNGVKHFTANMAITDPDDFIGKKIRVMKSRIIMEQFSLFGAEPVPIDFHSTKQALADSVVDGQENPLASIYGMGFHEVQTDLTLSKHANLMLVFTVSEQTMAKLPQHLQLVLLEAAEDVAQWQRNEIQKEEQQLLIKLEKAGMRVHSLSVEQQQAFRTRTAHLVENYEDVIGPNLISKTDEILYHKYDANPGAEVIIGINADMSNAPDAGLSIKRGVQLAVDEINQAGGILGKPVRVISRDHRIVTTTGVQNMRDFIANPDVIAVIGGKHSAVIANELEDVQRASMPYLIPWAASPKIVENGLTDNPVFRISANDKKVSKFIIADALKRHKRPAIIVENTIWGRGNLKRMQAYLAAKGMPEAPSLVFNRGQQDYQQEVAALLKSDPDCLVLVANAKEGSKILEGLGMLGSKLPIVSHWGIIGGTFWKDNQVLLQTIDLRFFQTFSFLTKGNPVADKLKQAYMSKYGVESATQIKAPNGVSQAYDLVHLLALAVEQAGELDRSKITQTLEQLPVYQGALKRYAPAFTPELHDALNEADFIMATFNATGDIIPVSE